MIELLCFQNDGARLLLIVIEEVVVVVRTDDGVTADAACSTWLLTLGTEMLVVDGVDNCFGCDCLNERRIDLRLVE